MKVLVACEKSGRVRDEFSKLGHDAWSCDLQPSDTSGNHIQDDVLLYLNVGWDLLIAHPPCTYLALSGNRWMALQAGREEKMVEAYHFAMKLANAPIHRICIEQPMSRLSSMWRKPDQEIQPWQFGDPYQKTTWLWLKNLPLLIPTKIVDKGEMVVSSGGNKYPKWYQNNDPNFRSTTWPGIAAAMAVQWTRADKVREFLLRRM